MELELYDLKATIIKLREENGWDQAELARRSTLSGAAISDIEAGKKTPRLDTLMKIAYAFGKELSELLEYSKKDRISIDISDKKSDLIEWASKAENEPYIEFVFNLSKEVPADSLRQIKIIREIEIKPGGQQNDGGQ